MQIKKKEKGITLIALVVTIVVLLILSGVTINFVVGDGGIIQKAKEAASKTNEAIKNEEENLNSFVDDITNILGQYDEEPEKEPETNLEKLKSELESNPDKFKNAAQIESNKDRAIGTDGKSVNLDLWRYYITEDGQGITLGKVNGSTRYQGYKGKIVEGKIEGAMPQYIYIDSSSKVLPVTGLLGTFFNYVHYGDETPYYYDDLVVAPDFPSTVVEMKATFSSCQNLTTIPEFPQNLKILAGDDSTGNSVFYNCTSLASIPKIPDSVTNMREAFAVCTGLENISEISKNVENMYRTFEFCKKLKGNIKINSKLVSNAEYCFDQDIENNITLQVPANSTTYNTFNSIYGSNPKITIQTF